MEANIESLIGRKVDEAALVGRGWWPIKDGKINRRKRPLKNIATLKGFESAYSVFTLDERDGEFSSALNWAKSVPVYEEDSNGQSFLIFALKVEDGVIRSVSQFRKECNDPRCMHFGFGFVELPFEEEDDSEMPYEMWYLDPQNNFADRMIEEVEKAISGRYVGVSHELVGRNLPSAYAGESDSGFSVVRNCYWSMSVETGEDGKIEGFDFSTYVSHGCVEANMFSRPQLAADHVEDVIYAMLRIVDAYTEEEWSR